ncbi:uncharacterized protein At4g19900-like [Silene latifolia]|uniref:uncharacterized protein At4g19900-like n=1 Tax=Silene latifolia TaxID=37657 RepID=UPI003D789581
MVGRHRSRRGVGYGAQLCGIATAFLLLLSIFLLYTRLSSTHSPSDSIEDPLSLSLSEDPLLEDSDPEPDPRTTTSEDRIDVLDDDKDVDIQLSNEEEILRALDDSDEDDTKAAAAGGYFFDHVSLVIRHAIDRRSIDEIDYANTINNNNQNPFQPQQHPKHNCDAIGSDDVPVDEDVRMKMMEVGGIEDVLLLKSSPLRKGWGPWFDAKTDFLRKDKMFRSNFHLLNPFHHLLLQDPDSIGLTALTKGDKIVQKGLVARRRIDKSLQLNQIRHNNNNKTSSVPMDKSRWGYFAGLPPFLSFSNFMDSFFRKCKCSMRVFMVWNSPSWMFTVSHQRGLESLLYHHPNACVVIFSETLELDFFKDFVNRSFKVAVAMPHLEQLLQDTPTSVFASVWHKWRTTTFYPTHYSELIRLSALFKYGGIYLDSDMIVLKPLSPFSNSVGMEEPSPGSPLNGAVMAFTKHSSFLMQCMSEFYSTYDDTLKRWNGAELLTRVARNFSKKATDPNTQQELKVQPSSIFFPIGSNDIQRYFLSPLNESEKVEQYGLYSKILNESYTFHLWNSITSALVPEAESLVARILNRYCTRCSDLL